MLLDEGAAAGARRSAARRRAFAVTSVEADPFTERPRAPFTTSTLQQESGRKLRYGAARTMAVAQRLYERGYITYMRTDSTNLSEQAITAARTAIREQYGEEYLPGRAARVSQQGEERAGGARGDPPGRRPHPHARRSCDSELDGDERRLYELIWIRTVACQMSDARGQQDHDPARRDVDRQASTRDVPRRRARPTTSSAGAASYVEDVDEGDGARERRRACPRSSKAQRSRARSSLAVGHETKPPARYTEASLVKELEERGIGRPSTYAAVIETIQARNYVWRKGTALVPGVDRVRGHQPARAALRPPRRLLFTATMEEALDVIARGEGEAEKWLHSFYSGTGSPVCASSSTTEQLALIDPRGVSTIPIGTDDTGHEIIVRVGRYGPYVQREDTETASLPPEIAPDELTVEIALDLIAKQADGPESRSAPIPRPICRSSCSPAGSGPYVQLGEQLEGTKKKPKRSSLFATMTPETVTLDEALQLLLAARASWAPTAEGREIDRLARPVRPVPEALRRRHAQPRVGGPAAHDHDGRGRGAVRAAEDAARPPAEAAARRARRAPRQRRSRCACSTVAYGPYVTDGNGERDRAAWHRPDRADAADEAVGAPAGPGRDGGRRRRKKAAKKATKKTAKKTVKKVAKKATKKPAKKATKAAAEKAGTPVEQPICLSCCHVG